jgi:ArsR family transcriptional regulator
MGELSLIFKALSDPLRLAIIRLLLRNGHEAYGEELARALDIPAYRLSRHLKVLKATGLISDRRVGRWVYYSLAKRNGQLLTVLRRLIADVNAPQRFGDGRRFANPLKRRSHTAHPPRGQRGLRRQILREEEFNWNQGPAIPGLL